MSKEGLELFRSEIENEANRRIETEADRRLVVKLSKMNIPISQIIQATNLSEDNILKIISGK